MQKLGFFLQKYNLRMHNQKTKINLNIIVSKFSILFFGDS